VRRRIGFAGVAVAAASLIVGVGIALAATPSHQKHAKGRRVLLHCTSSGRRLRPRASRPSTSRTAEELDMGR
jgi:hypothetical protein